jgi:hypothetical protein
VVHALSADEFLGLANDSPFGASSMSTAATNANSSGITRPVAVSSSDRPTPPFASGMDAPTPIVKSPAPKSAHAAILAAAHGFHAQLHDLVIEELDREKMDVLLFRLH